jgi:RHS repeat-associated protein
VVSAIPWDSQQRLTQVQTPELTATYRYDLLGRRVQRQITKPGQPPETTHYVYDGLQAVAEIRPQQSSTSFLTGLNLDEMLARVTTLNGNTTTQTRTYLTDALGSVMAQTQDNQSTLAGYSYSPYGHTQSTGNTEGDSVQYTAREHDANGLYYYRARYYDPVLKRFISEDPIGLQGGSLSFYAYVNGDPVSWTDPTGLANAGWQPSKDSMKPGPNRPDGNPRGWGCGDVNTEGVVPDSFNGVSFLPACRRHDVCYGTCGAQKAVCDQNLRMDMMTACVNAYQSNGLCMLFPSIYHKAMSLRVSQEAFDRAQKEACKDCK